MTFPERIESLRAWLDWHASSDLRSDRDAAKALGVALSIVELVNGCNCCDGDDASWTKETVGKLAEFIKGKP